MNMLRSAIGRDELRKSRFHDEKGNLVDLVGALHAPRAFAQALARRLFDYRPPLPWIPYRAIWEIDRLIQKDWKIVEFGSGMSTAWLAKRCAFLHSIESDKRWHDVVSVILNRQHITNVRYDHRSAETYSDLSEYADGFFDFALVDGLERSKCIRAVVNKIKRGGFVYLDNSDTDMTIPGGDVRRAEEALMGAVTERKGNARYFVDFPPATGFVIQGLLAKL